MIKVEKINGKKGVRIEEGYDDFELLTCRNGHQWSGVPIDVEQLVMLRDAIDEFLATNLPHKKIGQS